MKKYIAFVIFLIILIFVPSFCFSVSLDEYAAITRFGKVVRIIDTPGLAFKSPFVNSVSFMSKKVNFYDIPPSGVITKDKKSMIVDSYILWRISDPVKYIQTLGAIPSRAIERIEAIVYNSVKNIISAMNQDEVIAARGEELADTITKDSNRDTIGYGIEIAQAHIKMLDLPADNKEAVYERMISERQNIAAAYTAEGQAEAQKIRNAADREIAIMVAGANKSSDVLIAEGEASFMKILQDAYNSPEKVEFYSYLRGLDSLAKSLKNAGDVLILDKDSALAKLLYGD